MASNCKETLAVAGRVKGPPHVRSCPEIVGSAVVTPVVEPSTYEKPSGRLSVMVFNVTALAPGLLTVIVYCTVPAGPTVDGLTVFITERTVAPGWQAPASVVLRTSRSRNTAESIPRSPTSKMERYRAWGPGVIG